MKKGFFIITAISILVSAFIFSAQDVSAHTYPDGTIIRLEGDFKIYTIFKNTRRWIKNIDVFNSYGYKWENILVIPPEYIDDMPINNLIRQEGDIKIYAINDNGYKRHIANPEVFVSYGFDWLDVSTINKEELDNYQDSYLIREVNDPRVYYLEDNKKRWVDSIESFYTHNLNWDAIHVINNTDIGSYSSGDTVTSASIIQPPSGTISATPAIPAEPIEEPAIPAIPAQPATSTSPTTTSTTPIVPPTSTTSTTPTATSTIPTPDPEPTPSPSPTPSPTPTPTPSPTPTPTPDPEPTTTSTEPSVDTTPPVISNIQLLTITENTASITWDTGELSDSTVIYATISLISATSTTNVYDSLMKPFGHLVELTNLSSNTNYYYKVISTDASGNTATSTELSFTTNVLPPPTSITSTYTTPPNNRTVPSITLAGEITGLNRPAGIAVSSSGNIYVADYQNDKVKVYNSSLELIQTLGGSQGSGDGQFSEPWDIAFDNSSGNVFVSDTNNLRVQVFDSSGNYLYQFSTGSAHQGLAVNSDNFVYVSGREVGVFDVQGNKIADLTLTDNYYPRNIAIDGNNRVYFSNWGNQSVAPPYNAYVYDDNSSITIQTPAGELIKKVALDYQPYFITVDDLFRIWVADHTNGKIQVYDSEGVYITDFDLPFSPCTICGHASPGLNAGNPVGLEIKGSKLYASIRYAGVVRVYDIN